MSMAVFLREKQFFILSGKYKRFMFAHPVLVAIELKHNRACLSNY